MNHGIPNNIYSWTWGLGVPISYILLSKIFNNRNTFPGIVY